MTWTQPCSEAFERYRGDEQALAAAARLQNRTQTRAAWAWKCARRQKNGRVPSCEKVHLACLDRV